MAYVVIEEHCRDCLGDGYDEWGYACARCLTSGWMEVYVHEAQTSMEIPIGPDTDSPRRGRAGVQEREK